MFQQAGHGRVVWVRNSKRGVKCIGSKLTCRKNQFTLRRPTFESQEVADVLKKHSLQEEGVLLQSHDAILELWRDM